MEKTTKTTKFFEATPFEDVEMKYRAYKEAEAEGFACMHDVNQLCLIYKAADEKGLINGTPRKGEPQNQNRATIPHPDLHTTLIQLIRHRPQHYYHMKSLLLTLYTKYYGIVKRFGGILNTNEMIPGLFNKDSGDNNHVMEIFETLIDSNAGFDLFKKYLAMFDEYHQQVIVNNCFDKTENDANRGIYYHILPIYLKAQMTTRKILEDACYVRTVYELGYEKAAYTTRKCECIVVDHTCANYALNLTIGHRFINCGTCRSCLSSKGKRHILAREYSEMFDIEFTHMYNIIDAALYMTSRIDRTVIAEADPQEDEPQD